MAYISRKKQFGATLDPDYPTAATQEEFMANVYKNNITSQSVIDEITAQDLPGWADWKDAVEADFILDYTIAEFNQTEQSIIIERTWTSEEVYLKFKEYYNLALQQSSMLTDLGEFVESTVTL